MRTLSALLQVPSSNEDLSPSVGVLHGAKCCHKMSVQSCAVVVPLTFALASQFIHWCGML
jgi:hypothetical protein